MEYKKLGEIYDFQYGKGNTNPDNGGIYPIYGSNGIIGGYDQYNSEDSPVIGHIGANCGSVVWAKGKHFVTYNGIICKIKNGFDARFGYYSLLSANLKSKRRGCAQPFISYDLLDKTNVYCPSLPLQRRIASILSAYDNLIEANSRRIKILEQMAENLYKEWFVRFRFPNYPNTPIENGIPKGWKVERLKDFGITLTSGSRPKGGIDANLEEGVPSLGAESIKGLAEFDYSSVKLVPQEFYCQMKRGKNTGNDILLYKDGAYIGKTTLFRDGFPFKTYSINEHVFIISPIDQEYKNYLYFTLHQEAFFYLMQNLNRNAAQPGLSNNDINNIKMMIPNKELIAQYNLHVEPILKEIFKLAHQSANLTRQRDLLLPRLMSGQLTPLTNQ